MATPLLPFRAACGIARRPALAATVMFITGIALHGALPAWPLVWLGGAAGLLAIAVLKRSSDLASLPLGLAVCLAGVAAGQLADFRYPVDHISAFAGEEPRLGWCELRVEETPHAIASSRPHLPAKQMFAGEMTRVRTWDGWKPCTGAVAVSISPPREDVAAGQTLRVLGMLQRPATAMNPGEFDWSRYDRLQRLLATLTVTRSYDVQILTGGGTSQPLPWLREGARRALSAGFGANRELDRALLEALVLGDRGSGLHAVEDQFRRAGVTHLLASTGLRVAILAMFVYLAFRICCQPPRRAVWASTIAVMAFGLLMTPSPQALRPVLLSAAVGAGLMSRRSIDSIQLLALAAMAVLIVNPLDLYAAGFQLSFVTVLGLVVLTRPLLEFLRTFEDPHLRAARGAVPLGALARLKLWIKRWFLRAVAASLVAWLVSMPLVAYHFEQWNPWSAPVSVLLAPLVFVSLVGGFLKIGLTLLIPGSGWLWAPAAAAPVALLRWSVGELSGLPFALRPLAAPSLPMMAAYYGLLLLPLFEWPTLLLRRCVRVAPAGGCALLLAFPLHPGALAGGQPLRVTLLSVGAGQCAVIEPPDGRILLFDAGSATVSDVLRTTLGPFLRHEGRSNVDGLYLSHGDYDHISAAAPVLSACGEPDVFASPHFRRHAVESLPAESLVELLDRTAHSPHLIWQGETIDLGGDARLEVLWPPPKCDFNSNNSGVVLRLTFGGRSILFPADIQLPAERELLKDPARLRSDILVAPHHGSGEETTPAFLEAVAPQVVLCSNGKPLSMKQRLFDQMASGVPVYRTSQCGAISVEVSRDGRAEVSPFLSAGGAKMLLPRRP